MPDGCAVLAIGIMPGNPAGQLIGRADECRGVQPAGCADPMVEHVYVTANPAARSGGKLE
jgi:hypothetical protein